MQIVVTNPKDFRFKSVPVSMDEDQYIVRTQEIAFVFDNETASYMFFELCKGGSTFIWPDDAPYQQDNQMPIRMTTFLD